MDKTYTPIIGLEVHIEPNTKTKMFCSCLADHFGKKANTQVCPVCLGLPGILPFANKEAVKKTIKFGLAVGCKISNYSKFYRKNYFYPDLPKGFQTSQLDSPLCLGGTFNGKRINHIHLEEDAGKLVHQEVDGKKVSLIDFNRSSVPLMELVTEPDFHNTEEIITFLKDIQLIAKYLDISNADMEKGSMRLEANVSLSPDGSLPDYKVELKNINSFRFLEKAINAEIKRQEQLLLEGKEVEQETRGYDEVKQTTYTQRSKADAHDYRYFPEADLPPMRFTDEQIEKIKNELPELPKEKSDRFQKEYDLPKDFADILIQDLNRAKYYEEAVKLTDPKLASPKFIADLIINKKLDEKYPEAAGLVKRVIELKNVEYSGMEETGSAVMEVVSENEKAVNDYKKGNVNVLGFLVGMVQKKLQGKGDINVIKNVLQKKL